ncbi:MAG: hypothetical protein ACLU0O_02250 [Collinsella sp.]
MVDGLSPTAEDRDVSDLVKTDGVEQKVTSLTKVSMPKTPCLNPRDDDTKSSHRGCA